MNPLQFLLALALEAGAALLLWTGERDVLQLGAYLAVHALACAVLALALLPLLPGRLRQPPLAVARNYRCAVRKRRLHSLM